MSLEKLPPKIGKLTPVEFRHGATLRESIVVCRCDCGRQCERMYRVLCDGARKDHASACDACLRRVPRSRPQGRRTPLQRTVLAAIASHWRTHRRGPTLEDLSAALPDASRANVKRALTRLQREGDVTEAGARFKLTAAGRTELQAA